MFSDCRQQYTTGSDFTDLIPSTIYRLIQFQVVRRNTNNRYGEHASERMWMCTRPNVNPTIRLMIIRSNTA